MRAAEASSARPLHASFTPSPTGGLMRSTVAFPTRRFVRAGAFVALTLVCAPRPATAQSAAENAAAIRTTYLADLESLQGKFLQLAEAIPADKYAWRPAPGVRS